MKSKHDILGSIPPRIIIRGILETNMKIKWEKIDKFYLVLVGVLILMALLVILTFRSVFSAYLIAYELKQDELSNDETVNETDLNSAYSFVFDKKTIPLEVR